ncbi:MAG: flippase-like domain-containing protein [Planctomycetes bacterium]|nr:flippase-like domain-containing protein [Planctomycetota bacterium]
MALPKKLSHRLLFGVLLGLGFYVALALWSDVRGIAAALERLSWWVIPAACGLSFLNYVVRFAKWQRYLTLLAIRIDAKTSFLIYLSGLSMSVTPGKMGEVFKSWLLKKVTGTPISRSAPIVFAERFTDLLGYLLLIAIGGLASAGDYAWIFWATLALCVVALCLVGNRAFGDFALRLADKLPVLKRATPKLEVALASTRILLAPREILMPTFVSFVGWGLECTGFWLIANAIVPDSVPYLFAIFAFALSAVAGAVAIVFPGGLVITEGFLGTLLRPRYQPAAEATLGLAGDAAREYARSQAAGTVILARVCTLWFAVLVGFLAMGLFTRRFGAVEEEPTD